MSKITTQPIHAADVPAQSGKTIYPPAFASVVSGRTKRKLGEQFDLSNFGVNLTELAPGAASSVMHCHSKQDEFLYILKGTATVLLGDEEFPISEGDCIGFKAGTGTGHQLLNRSQAPVVYLEIGDRMAGDEVTYPRDDLHASLSENGSWVITHKDGTPY